MAGLRQRTLLDGNDLFMEFKGALTEQCKDCGAIVAKMRSIFFYYIGNFSHTNV